MNVSDDWLLAQDESITRADAERLARGGDAGVLSVLVWNSAVPVELIWELAARDPQLRASATNHSDCPLPILLGQPLRSVPSYQLDRVVGAVVRDDDTRGVAGTRLVTLGQQQDDDALTLAQALTDLTGIDWTAFALPG